MTARQAEELAHKLWGNPENTRIGRVRRGRKSPIYRVGYVDINGGGRWLGESNVDWESAFAIAAERCDSSWHTYHCTKSTKHRGRHHEVRGGMVVASW